MYSWLQADDELIEPSREAHLVAFAESIDAWGHVEWHFNSILRLMIKSNDEDFSFAIFGSCGGVRNQIELIKSVGGFYFSRFPVAQERLRKLLERSRRLAKKRNHIVHAKWIKVSCVDENDQVTSVHFYRDAAKKTMQTIAAPEDSRQFLKGRQRFFIDDLHRARDEFLALAKELFLFTGVYLNPSVASDEIEETQI